jgi:pimeloyl-ACP methyl ester carboxylesterase
MRAGPTTGRATSADGTGIVFGRSGSGPGIILVHGAFTDRSHPTLARVADALAPWFTVVNYDRRGRGDSGDTQPYAVQREIEDLAALVQVADGPAMVFGGSSGAALALRAAAQIPAISKLALWEPPYHVGPAAPRLPHDFATQLGDLVTAGRRAEAAGLFLVQAAEVPAETVAEMRAQPSWPQIEAIAHTLSYEAAIMGPGNELPARLLTTVTQPTLVLTGGNSPGWMASAGRAVAEAVPAGSHRVLAGQTHNVAPQAIVPELLEFFTAT